MVTDVACLGYLRTVLYEVVACASMCGSACSGSSKGLAELNSCEYGHWCPHTYKIGYRSGSDAYDAGDHWTDGEHCESEFGTASITEFGTHADLVEKLADWCPCGTGTWTEDDAAAICGDLSASIGDALKDLDWTE